MRGSSSGAKDVGESANVPNATASASAAAATGDEAAVFDTMRNGLPTDRAFDLAMTKLETSRRAIDSYVQMLKDIIAVEGSYANSMERTASQAKRRLETDRQTFKSTPEALDDDTTLLEKI